MRDDLRVAISFVELVERVLIKSWIQQRSTDVLSNGWSEGVVKMSDTLRVGAYSVMDENLKHLNEHWPISGISIEAWRLHAGWFDCGTTHRSMRGTKGVDPRVRCVNSGWVVGHWWGSRRTRKTRREYRVRRHKERCRNVPWKGRRYWTISTAGGSCK